MVCPRVEVHISVSKLNNPFVNILSKLKKKNTLKFLKLYVVSFHISFLRYWDFHVTILDGCLCLDHLWQAFRRLLALMAIRSSFTELCLHTTIGQTLVDFVNFHRWVETNSWILMTHMSFDMTSFSFRLTCPV